MKATGKPRLRRVDRPRCRGASELQSIRRELGLTQVQTAGKLQMAQSTYALLEMSDDQSWFETRMLSAKAMRTDSRAFLMNNSALICRIAKVFGDVAPTRKGDFSVNALATRLSVGAALADPDFDDAQEAPRVVRSLSRTQHIETQAYSPRLGIIHPAAWPLLSQGQVLEAEKSSLGEVLLPEHVQFTSQVLATVVPDDEYEQPGPYFLPRGSIVLLTEEHGPPQEEQLYLINRRGTVHLRVVKHQGQRQFLVSPAWNRLAYPTYRLGETTRVLYRATPYSTVMREALEAFEQQRTLYWPQQFTGATTT